MVVWWAERVNVSFHGSHTCVRALGGEVLLVFTRECRLTSPALCHNTGPAQHQPLKQLLTTAVLSQLCHLIALFKLSCFCASALSVFVGP